MKQFSIDHGAMAHRFAPVMFCLSLLFLVLVAALIVVWVDVPRFEIVGDGIAVVTPGEAVSIPDPINAAAQRIGTGILYVIIVLWTVIGCEVLVQLFISVRAGESERVNRWRIFAFLQCVCPPLRLAAPNIAKNGQIWLPSIGWQAPSRKLFKNLESTFSKPMLFFALLILPLLLIEFGLHSVVSSQTWLRLTIHVCTGLIWCAFAIEFIVLVSVSQRRLAYVKKNWIDLAIILLPIILFLRSLRAIRLARVAKFAKVQQLVNMSRVYRVRGVALKAVRALLLFEVFSRVLRISPVHKLNRLKADYDDKMEELEELRTEIEKIEKHLVHTNEPKKQN